MRARTCPYLLLLLALPGAGALAVEPGHDFRMVIDVSGSMKQTDPRNLRRSAMKLINGLVPSGSSAGVWTFGKYVNMTVKWGRVDDAWRRLADRGADEIHSNALLTNIESALERASVGWKAADATTRRVLLLLTDGKVDVGKDPDKNAASRQRILGNRLSALKRAGVEVHAVGLSAAADQVLLKRLAVETGGSFTVAENAGQLQRAFLRVFERAQRPDTIEFDGQEFPVDGSVSEMTLLIFRQPGAQPPTLVSPAGEAISAARPGAARWREDPAYDLVTVDKPAQGTWRIDGEMDPDNRLMVVTDLRLDVSGIPAQATPRDAHEVVARLLDRDRQITRNSFLRFVDFSLTHTGPDGRQTRHPLAHSELRADKGQFGYALDGELAEGRHSFVVAADARTFNRSKRFDLQVQWPVEIDLARRDAPGAWRLRLRARQEFLKPDGLAAEVAIEAPDGSREMLPMSARLGWLIGDIDTAQDGIYRAHVKVSAQNHAGEIREHDLGDFNLLGVYVPPEPAAEAPTPAEPTADGAGQVDSAARSGDLADDGDDLLMLLAVVGGVNALLAVGGLAGWLMYRGRRRPPDILLEDRAGA